jgi:CheY-like chemotaxis protein
MTDTMTNNPAGHPSDASAVRRTVLVVDDDRDFLFQQKLQLEAAGFDVLEATGTHEAAEILSRQRPDLAVVDLMMENADDGFTFCYHLKKKDPTIPVIMVTSVNSETGMDFDAATDEERRWIKVDAFLSKPIRFEQLKQQIDRLLKG